MRRACLRTASIAATSCDVDTTSHTVDVRIVLRRLRAVPARRRPAGARPRQLGFLEAVHSHVPLQRNDGAFDRLQQTEGENEGGRQPQHQVHPVRRRKIGLHRQHGRNQQVADDEDHDIGGKIIGPMMVQLLAAHLAMILHLKKGAEHPSLAAARAAAEKPAHDLVAQQSRGKGIGHRVLPRIACVKRIHTISSSLLTLNAMSERMYGLAPYAQ